MKTIELTTTDNSGINQSTKIDNTTQYKDFNYTIGKNQNIDIKNYTDENGVAFEINGVAIFGEHLKLLRDFLNK